MYQVIVLVAVISNSLAQSKFCFQGTSSVADTDQAEFTAVGGSPSGLWAVGYDGDFAREPLINTWTVSGWQKQNLSTGAIRSELNGVAPGPMIGTAWAVGSHGNYDIPGYWMAKTLTAYFDGTSWTQVPSPNRGDIETTVNQLNAVARVAPNEWYAVGQYSAFPEGAAIYSLVLHYADGVWRLVKDGDQLPYALTSVSGQASDDVWIAGFQPYGAGGGNFVEHWNGHVWTPFHLPNPGMYWNALYSIAEVAPDDVWVVGHADYATSYPVAFHYDGTTWNQVTGFPRQGGGLYSIQAWSGGYVWAAGWYSYGVNAAPWVLQLTGANRWTEWSLPDAETASPNLLRGIAITSPGEITAVGRKVPQAPRSVATAYNSSWCPFR